MLAYAMTNQGGIAPNASTPASRVRDFARMNPSNFMVQKLIKILESLLVKCTRWLIP